jgi:hypothetical protein
VTPRILSPAASAQSVDHHPSCQPDPSFFTPHAAQAAAEADEGWVRALWDDPEGWLNGAELPPADRANLEDPERRRSFL